MIKVLVYVVFIGFPLILSAQNTFQITVEKNDSTSPSSATHSITETSNGEIYAMSTISPGGWYNKIRVVKLSDDGTVLWDNTYAQTPEHEFFPDIMPAHDGGVIVACTSYSYPLYDNDTVSDILIWKINAQGAIEWEKILAAREFYDMTITNDGGYLFAGTIHEKPFNQGADIIIYKTDAAGNVLWHKELGQRMDAFPYEREWPNSIRQIDNKIYVCGFHVHDGWIETDGIMYVLDANGNLLWDIFIPHAPNNVRVNSVFKFDSQYYFKATGGLFEFDPYSGNYWAVPDSVDFVFGSSGKGYTYYIECGVKKAVAVIPSPGIFELKLYDNLVEPYYEKVISGVSGTYVEMIASKDGGVLILTGDGDNMQITKTDCIGNVDHWSDECYSKISKDKQLLIYPNPSENELRIEATFDFNEVVIFAPNGQYVSFNNPCSCPRQTLDISELAAGVYIVRISSDQNFAVSKFVKL